MRVTVHAVVSALALVLTGVPAVPITGNHPDAAVADTGPDARVFVNEVHYVVSGASGKLRTEPPRHFEQAGTRAWAPAGHFLLARADERAIVLHALADVHEDGTLEPIEAVDPEGRPADARLDIAPPPV